MYIHCRIGDIKAHTWDNGIIQTWYPFGNSHPLSDRTFDTYFDYNESIGNTEYNGKVCIEFIGTFGQDYFSIPSSNISTYNKIRGINFYPNQGYQWNLFD